MRRPYLRLVRLARTRGLAGGAYCIPPELNEANCPQVSALEISHICKEKTGIIMQFNELMKDRSELIKLQGTEGA